MTDQEIRTLLRSWLEEHKEEFVRDLAVLIAIPSIKSEGEKDAPFGKLCAEALEKACELYEQNGFPVARFPQEGYALAGTENGKIGLYLHTDVVPAGGEWLRGEPFQLTVDENEFLIGRGVQDNKGGVVAALYLLRAFRELGLTMKNDLTVFLGSNEEDGMEDISAYASRGVMPDFSLVPDGDFPLTVGQKGIYRFDVTTPPVSCFRSITGGEAYNVVMDRVEAELTVPVKAGTEKVTVEGKNVTALGKASHASEARSGYSALAVLADWLVKEEAVSEHDRAILSTVAESAACTDGSVFGVAGSDPHFRELTSANGMVRLENGCLKYTFDIRFGMALPEETMLARINDYFTSRGCTVTRHSLSHCQLNPDDTPRVRAFMEGYHALTGRTDQHPFVMGGGTYAYYLKNAYATGYMYFDRPYSSGGGAHQIDEAIGLGELLDGTALLGTLLLKIDKVEETEKEA